MSIKILVCGGRDFNNYAKIDNVLTSICDEFDYYFSDNEVSLCTVTIISGMAKGADSLAAEWAENNGAGLMKFPADWSKHGKAAGPIRNQQMLDEGKPELVIAFPGGRGTTDMINRSKKVGIEVIEIVD